MGLNTVRYKEKEDLQTKIEGPMKVEQENTEQKPYHWREEVKINYNLTHIASSSVE